MSDGTKIEWTDATWNPITGCSVVSPGCTNCYAMGLAGTRLRNHPSRAGLTDESKAGPVWNGKVRLNEDWLTQPLKWRRPRTIFVCAHGDLFHEAVPDEWIDRVFAVMALCPQHTFQVLTKRAKRMQKYLTRPAGGEKQDVRNHLMWVATPDVLNLWAPGWEREEIDGLHRSRGIAAFTQWPLPNVWLGVSAEDQKRADERVPDLLATPAAVRFVSAEPLLGPIDFERIDDGAAHRDVPREEWGTVDDDDSPPALWWNALTGERTIMHGGATGDWSRTDSRLDWIIVGGESGPNARPMHPDWPRAIRDQCAAAGVPFFFKQHGEFAPEGLCSEKWIVRADGSHGATPTPDGIGHHAPQNGSAFVYRVGKRRAGRLLDGQTHDAMPARPT